jgi:hypothetical protein
MLSTALMVLQVHQDFPFNICTPYCDLTVQATDHWLEPAEFQGEIMSIPCVLCLLYLPLY